MRGPTFQLFRIPIRIEIWFVVTLLLIGLDRLRLGLVYFLQWMILATVVLLVHELAHAFAYRRYGQEPSIVLWGLGGLTFGEYPLPPRRSIVVALAGSVTTLLLIGLPARWALENVTIASPYVAVALNDLWFVGGIWALVNLLPLRPLDGGHVTEDVLHLATGEPRLQTARLISVVTGVAFGTWVFVVWGSTLALLLGYGLALYNFAQYIQERNASAVRFEIVPEEGQRSFGGGYDNVTSMKAARQKRDKRSSGELLRDGEVALESRQYREVLRIAERLAGKRLSGDQAIRATELAAWGWLGYGDGEMARETLTKLPKGASPSPGLDATTRLVLGESDAALGAMRQLLIAGQEGIDSIMAVELFAEHGMTHRLARELVDLDGGKGFEAAVALEGTLVRLHRTQDASTVSDVILLG